MNNSFEKKQRINSFAFVFLIFVYSITTIFSLVANQGIVIILTSVVLLGPILLLNIKYLKVNIVYALLFEFIILVILLIHKNRYPLNSSTIDEIIMQLLGIGTLSIVIGTLDNNIVYVEKYFGVLSILCFFTSFVYLILVRGNFLLSMRFGYAMLPSAVWFLCSYIKKRKVGWLLLFILATVLLITYGSRGTLLCIAMALVLIAVKCKWWWLLLFTLVFMVFSNVFFQLLEQGLQWLANLTGSRKILNLILLFQGDITDASSGRDTLYSRCIQLFHENPFGNGVGFWQSDSFMYGLYPHNILLEIAVEFGVFGILIFSIILVSIIIKLFRLDLFSFFPYAALFSICFGRLMVSSTFWSRPEFWLIVSVFLFNPPQKQGSTTYQYHFGNG